MVVVSQLAKMVTGSTSADLESAPTLTSAEHGAQPIGPFGVDLTTISEINEVSGAMTQLVPARLARRASGQVLKAPSCSCRAAQEPGQMGGAGRPAGRGSGAADLAA